MSPILKFKMEAVEIFCLLALVPVVMVSTEAHRAECRFIKLKQSETPTTIESPNYPYQYPADICILWFYSHSSKPGLEFVLRILDLDLPGKMGSCMPSNDSVKISMASQNLLCGKSEELSTTEYRERLTEKHSTVYIRFNSTPKLHKGAGFSAEYFMLQTVNQAPLGESESDIDSAAKAMMWSENQNWLSPCFSVLTNRLSGHIPQQTISFRTLRRCNGSMSWLVVAPKPQIPFIYASLTLDVDLSSCPKHQMHPEDLFEVFDGRNASMPLLIRCSKYGRVVIGSHVTQSDSFYVRYQSTVSQPLQLRLKFKRKARCFEGFISCGNEDACYPPSGRCNGSQECPLRGRDELNCGSTQCPAGKYSCALNSHHCYEEKDRCNGKGTCTNYKDEMNCDPSQCNQEKGLFLCSNSRCIYEKWRCDGTSDCADNSDESGCGSMMTPRVIVAAVVGSLTCSLLMVVALGFVCKVYRLRQLQLSGVIGSSGSCCTAHCRHDSPLTRQLAEMFRQRAPPPPYHEAMLTSRPYHEVFRESGQEGSGGAVLQDAEGRHNERGGTLREGASLRRRESDPNSEGIVCGPQRPSNRRSRARRQHREVVQQDSSYSGSHENSGFIEVGALNLLGSGLSHDGEEHQSGHCNPPPYSVSDPANTETLVAREEAAGTSSGDDNDEGGSGEEDVDGEEGMPLRRQRKMRRSRSNRVEERRTGVSSSELYCLEMSHVTRRMDRSACNSGQSLNPQSQIVLAREQSVEDCCRIDDESCKREDEISQASLSLSSSTRLEPSNSFQRTNPAREQEDSDSDCILLGEEDADDKDQDEEDDMVDDDDEEMDPNFEEDTDDSDTACLLSTV